MIPFQQSYEFTFGAPTTSQGYQIQDDLIIQNYDYLEDNLVSFSIGSAGKESSKRNDLKLNRQRQKQSNDESSSKKVMHREVEKKRRQEMSKLHASLRSLLPDHLIKGKRSVSDQMQAALTHIKTMEKNIKELKDRRDELKSLYAGDSSGVTINMMSDGMEILIYDSIERSELGLSRLLAELEGCELDVIRTVSTRVKEGFVHKIQVEARNVINLDLSVLQYRLKNAIKNLP